MVKSAFPWWAILLPAVVVGGFEFVRHALLDRWLPVGLGNLTAAMLVGLGSALYVWFMAAYIRQAEQRLSAAREQTAVLQERDRIAREMHDSVSQALFYTGVKLGDIDRHLVAGEQQAAYQLVGEVRRNVDQTYDRVRAAIADLRRRPTPSSLGAGLEQLLAEIGSEFPLQVTVEQQAGEVALPEPVLTHLLGIIREALVNVAKHGGVRAALVSLRCTDQALEVTVLDQGRGFDPQGVVNGFGLPMMGERAELIGALFTLESDAGRGTAVKVVLPLEGEYARGTGSAGR